MGQCYYFDWHDDEVGPWYKVVIRELLDYIDTLHDENAELRIAKEDLNDIAVEMKKIFPTVHIFFYKKTISLKLKRLQSKTNLYNYYVCDGKSKDFMC